MTATIGTDRSAVAPDAPRPGATVVNPDRPATARIAVERVHGRMRLSSLNHGEYLSPRLLGSDAAAARVAVIATRASVLAGDHVGLDVLVGSHARLDLSEPAGTVAYNSRGAEAAYDVRIRVAAGGVLVWDGAPLVIAAGAALRRTVTVDIEPGGVALIRDLLALGRSYEPRGGKLFSRLRVSHDGTPLLVEDLDLWDPEARHAPGILDRARVVSTALVLGVHPEDRATTEEPAAGSRTTYLTRLAGPGNLARAVTDQAHLAVAELEPVWRTWRTRIGSPIAWIPMTFITSRNEEAP